MRTIIFKLISIVVLITFLCQNMAWSAPLNQPSAISHRPSVSIYIPEQYGSVEQKTEDRGQMSEKTVILVKDAHCVYEAQTNISKILETLVRDYKIDLVCVEGAEGLVDTSIFSAYPDQKVRKKAADKYF